MPCGLPDYVERRGSRSSKSASDPNAEYLSDGLTDGLIDRLSNIPKLRVMSHSAVFRYKGGQVDPQAAGIICTSPHCPPDVSVSMATALKSTQNW
jgi:hypothetical protein